MDGLSAGQLSFLLSAGLDTTNSSQPQEMNDTCRCLCGDLSPTVLHILNECTVALNQLRYTWRHDQQEDRLYIILFQTIGQTMSFQFTCIHDGTVLYSASLLPHPSIQWTLFSLWYI